MLQKIFTFTELQKEQGWESRPHAVERQIAYARRRGVYIEKVGNEIPQKFQLVENPPYTFRQLIEKYQWDEYPLKSSVDRQIIYAKSRGVEIEVLYRNNTGTYYKIIKEIKGLLEEWVPCATLPEHEISAKGLLRRKDNKMLVGSKNYAGYMKINNPNNNQTLFIHRLVMLTFCPIENPQNYVVDHINGIRDDNRVENLRWVLRRENNQFKDDNWALIGNLAQQLIEKIGYEQTYEILQRELDKIDIV